MKKKIYLPLILTLLLSQLFGAKIYAQFTQMGSKLVGTGASSAAQQGYSVSLSFDGRTALISGPLDNGNTGAIWIFTFNGINFIQVGSKLVGTGAIGSYVNQGTSVSISSDGKTVLVGGNGDNNTGAAWIYTYNGNNFVQAGNKLVGSGAAGSHIGQGSSVSLSNDGKTAIVGGYDDNGGIGAMWVYTFNGNNYAQLGTKIVGTNTIGSSAQGISISLSGDGKTALLGGSGDNNFVGAAWVFTYNGSTFQQVGNKLVGAGSIGSSYQGYALCLSGDGKTAAVGGLSDNTSIGAVWVYTFNGSNFVQLGNKLVGTGTTAYANFGSSVSLSWDGKTLLVGGYRDNNNVGAIWVFTYNGSNFIQISDKFTGIDAIGTADQGTSVSMSGNGKIALVGGYGDNSGFGAAWVFTTPGAFPTITQTITGLPSLLSQIFSNIPYTVSGVTATSGLPVNFSGNNHSVALVSSIGVISFVGLGNVTITASQIGDSNYYPANLITQILTVTQSTQSISGFNSILELPIGISTYTISGVAATSGLPVTFSGNNSSIALVSSNGVVSFVGLGNVTITAYQVGNANYFPANSISQVLTIVNQAHQTITGFNPIPNQILGNSSHTITGVTATSGLLVTFSGNNPTVALVSSNGVVSFVGLGNVTITANQVGNANYLAANPVNQVLTIVNKVTQTILGFNAIPSQTLGSAPYVISGVTATSGLPVTFSGNNPSVALVSSIGVVSLVGAGNVTITASQVGNANYLATSKSITLQVLPNTISGTNTVSGFLIQSEQAAFVVYPNPSSGTITIEINESTNETVVVYNSLGNKIAEWASGQYTLPKGLYLLRLQTTTKKLIVE